MWIGGKRGKRFGEREIGGEKCRWANVGMSEKWLVVVSLVCAMVNSSVVVNRLFKVFAVVVHRF